MKRILLFTVLLPALVFSQKHEKVKVDRIPPQWDTLFFKNEFSLDVSPVIGALITSTWGNKYSFAAVYRRFLDKNDAIRIVTRHSLNSDLTVTRSPEYNPNIATQPFKAGDIVYTETYRNYHYYSPDLRIGYEHRFGKRRVKFMLGLDVIAGAELIRNNEVYNHYRLTQVTDSSEVYYTLTKEEDQNSRMTDNKTVNLKTGFSPFAGIQIHLTKRISLNASSLFDFYWSIPLSSKGPSSINLDSDAIVADIGLTVHF